MNQPQPCVPILVVDDEEVITIALGEILRQARYEVLTLSDPAAALEELKRREFSVVISDQKMPGLSGLELLAEAKRLQPKATRILITGVLNLETVIEAINQGEIFRFIVKPWLREEFLATVSNALQRYELLCQNERLQAATHAVNAELAAANQALEDKIKIVADQNQQLAKMNWALEESFSQSLDLCVQTLETFHPALGAQARCVAKVCQSVASVLGLSPAERCTLESAARLYDLGLLGLPRSLIRRWQESPDDLSAEEKDLIQRHPVVSEEVVSLGGSMKAAGKIIRSHHERFDGRGYPDSLRGEEPPWLARLLAVAVSYAATSLAPAQALQQIQAGAGSRFDPRAVDVLLRALPEAGLPSKEKEIAFKELAPGMILARAIYSHNGLLLIPEGQRLNTAYIEKLVAHNRSHPLNQSLHVYC